MWKKFCLYFLPCSPRLTCCHVCHKKGQWQFCVFVCVCVSIFTVNIRILTSELALRKRKLEQSLSYTLCEYIFNLYEIVGLRVVHTLTTIYMADMEETFQIQIHRSLYHWCGALCYMYLVFYTPIIILQMPVIIFCAVSFFFFFKFSVIEVFLKNLNNWLCRKLNSNDICAANFKGTCCKHGQGARPVGWLIFDSTGSRYPAGLLDWLEVTSNWCMITWPHIHHSPFSDNPSFSSSAQNLVVRG